MTDDVELSCRKPVIMTPPPDRYSPERWTGRCDDSFPHACSATEEEGELRASPHQVERERHGEIDAEEAVELGEVVLTYGADDRLDDEQSRHHEEEPRARALGRWKRIAGPAEGQRGLSLPAEHGSQGLEQVDPPSSAIKVQDAPDDHIRGRG